MALIWINILLLFLNITVQYIIRIKVKQLGFMILVNVS